MYKEIVYDITANTKIDKSLQIEVLDSFIKTASSIPEYLKEWVASVKRKPNHTYVLVSAVGAGEYWGANKNGDYFPEEALLSEQEPDELRPGEKPKPRYLTFMDANFFKFHNNKPYSPTYGYVAGVFYDHEMHKVVLIIGVDNEKAPDIDREIEEGKIIAVSMGCKVPYDVCSICGNKAKTRSQYCVHLKTKMNQILPDGRKVYAINTKPRFFDISYVTRPAWRGGLMMAKVASCFGDKCSIELAEEVGTAERDHYNFDILFKTASSKKAEEKNAEIKKEVEGRIVKLIREESLQEPTLPHSLLDALAELPLSECWGNLLYYKILPKPNEFAYLITKKHSPMLAEELLAQPFVFDPNVKPVFTPGVKIVRIKRIVIPKDILTQRSFDEDTLRKRLINFIMHKEAAFMETLLLLAGLAGLYKALRMEFSKATVGPVIVGAQAYRQSADTFQPRYIGTYMMEKQSSANPYLYFPALVAPYIYSAYTKGKDSETVFSRNPGKTAIGSLGLVATGERLWKNIAKKWR